MEVQWFCGLQHAVSEGLNEPQMLHILDASSGTLVLIFGVLLNGLFQLEKDAHGCFFKESPWYCPGVTESALRPWQA